MVMVVRCKCCMTEYRLDEALLKGAKGACIRCPKCRERIIVVNPQPPPAAPPITRRVTPPPEAPIDQLVRPPVALRMPPRGAPPVASPKTPPQPPPDAPPAAMEAGTTSIRAATPKGTTSPVPLDRRAGGADLSGRIRSDPMAGVDDGIVVSPTPNAAPGPPDIPERNALRLEELFIHPSDVKGDRIPGREEDRPIVSRSAGTGRTPTSRRPKYQRSLLLAATISILLLAGGAFYFVDGISGRTSSGNAIPVRARTAPGHAGFDVGNLKGNLNRQASGVPFYVIKGTVTNVGKDLYRGIRIEATLLGRDNQAILRNGSFAGNVIDESLIPHMTRVRVDGFLGMRYGEGDVNRNIPAGKTLPFMVVFFDPPERVESYRVKAIDAGEADRTGSPDGEDPVPRASSPQPVRSN